MRAKSYNQQKNNAVFIPLTLIFINNLPYCSFNIENPPHICISNVSAKIKTTANGAGTRECVPAPPYALKRLLSNYNFRGLAAIRNEIDSSREIVCAHFDPGHTEY